MLDLLQKVTNFSGEIFESPEVCTYVLSDGIIVEISGINNEDCLSIFNKRREEFSKGKCNITMYTPRLTEYYQRRKKIA
jgi:hypothetical protein